MILRIPEYVELRIRRPVPVGSNVVPGSTPVISFGNAQTGRVATLGLNPSSREFRDKSGRELSGPQRRLATLQSLALSSLERAPASAITRVLDDCSSYFQRNPYRRWFDQLEPILIDCGASYYDGSACHLDLVQWATDPTWRHLSPEVRTELAEADGAFLLEQLQNENLELLLLNGSGVRKLLEDLVRCRWVEHEPIDRGPGLPDTRLVTATILGGLQVIGWSTNIQSSHGVTEELRAELALRIADLAEPTTSTFDPVIPPSVSSADSTIVRGRIASEEPPLVKPPDRSPRAFTPRHSAGEILRLRFQQQELCFVWCPPGSFLIGSPTTERRRQSNEAQVEVTLTHGFWMLQTPVIQPLYEQVNGKNPSLYKGARRPVDSVSRTEAGQFCDLQDRLLRSDPSWHSAGLDSQWHVALPTEAQWEYACRAGTTTSYFWSDDPEDAEEHAWFFHEGELGRQSHDVATKQPNPWGLFDMTGNVWEWCRDLYHDRLRDATDPVCDEQFPAPLRSQRSGWHWVNRGGSWYHKVEHCRSARRGHCLDHRVNHVGFRICLAK